MLKGWRILDLTDHRGEVGPYLLADLGASVTKVVAHDHDGRDGTGDDLIHRTYSSNKALLRLDGGSGDRATLLSLIADSDIVFDSWPGGLLDRHDIAKDDMTATNPTVVRTLVTPFGASGPRARQPASELTVAALGGPMRLQGVPDRAPVHASVPQVWRHAGAEAAVASLIAHRRMRATGQAQFVDVSAQSTMTWTMLNAMESHAVCGRDVERNGSNIRLSLNIPLRQRTADGYTICVPTGRLMPFVIDWLVEERIVEPHWRDEDWRTFDHRVISGEPTPHSMDEVIAAIQELCTRYGKYELFERGLTLGASFAPLNNLADLLDFAHLDARSFWTEGAAIADGALEHGSLGGHPANSGSSNGRGGPIRTPGAFYRCEGQRPKVQRNSPDRASAPGPAHAVAPPLVGDLACEGLKVVDFSWIGVGPMTAKALADHGATVIRVESEARIDGLRTQPPFAESESGINRSQFFNTFNTSKRSLSIDLKTDEGRSIARRLTQWADVVVESFTPGAMDRLGLGYESIKAENPSVVMVSTNLLGDGSHVSSMAGYGYHAAAVAGFQDLVGWPDLPPDGPYLAYTDTIGPRFITSALLAALDRRDRTGEGTHIEAAQLEVALQLLAPELIRYQLDGELPPRRGNRTPGVAPQGAYPCAGDDQWLAVSITSDEQWQSLVELLGRPAWALDPTLASVAGRCAAQDEIDEQLARWTQGWAAPELEEVMAASGIPAGTVQASSQLLTDPQYRHRGFYVTLEHEEVGPLPYAGHQYRIDGYDHGPRSAAPCLGNDSFEILTELLGMDVDEVAAIAASGALV